MVAVLCEFHVTFRSTDFGLARQLSSAREIYFAGSVHRAVGQWEAPVRDRMEARSAAACFQPAAHVRRSIRWERPCNRRSCKSEIRESARRSLFVLHGRKFETLRTACGKRRVLNSPRPTGDALSADHWGSLFRHAADDSNVSGRAHETERHWWRQRELPALASGRRHHETMPRFLSGERRVTFEGSTATPPSCVRW